MNRSINPQEKKRIKKRCPKSCYSDYQETRTIIVPECMEGVSKIFFASTNEQISDSTTSEHSLLFPNKLMKEKRRKKRHSKKHKSQNSDSSLNPNNATNDFSTKLEQWRTSENKELKEKVQRRRQIDPTTCERDYSFEEIEFMNALDQYKRMNGRMFPTCSEILEVIKSLGYVRSPKAEIIDPPPIQEACHASSPKIKPTIPFLSSRENEESASESDCYDSYYEYREPLMIY